MKVKFLFTVATLLLSWGFVQSPRPADDVELFKDDFSRFPPGMLSAPIGLLNGAIQEYHYLEHRGVPTYPWRNPIVHLDSWAAGDEADGPYLEQHAVNLEPERVTPLFVTGDPEWRDYRVELSVKPLSLDKEAGLVVRYRTSRHYYRLALEGGTRLRLAIRLPFDEQFRVAAWRELASVPFPYDTKTWYRLEATVEGDRLRASVDGRPLIDVRDRELTEGIAGLTANTPARFRSFRVTATPENAAALRQRVEVRDRDLARLRAENPQPKLWRKFDTPDFGAGRNVRFGDLDGDGAPEMLFAQNVPKVRGDAFDHISCLTAVSLDGRVLWQQGRPNPKNGLLTNDTPFQIHDLDGDGRAEVVLARDFQLQVLDGRTGRLLRSAWLPKVRRRRQGSPLRSQHRRLAAVRRSGRPRRAARDPAQGSLPRILDLRQGPEAALGGPGADRSLSVSRRHERRRQPGVPDRLFALGRRRHAPLEPRRRAQGSRRRAVDRQFHRPSFRGAARLHRWIGRRVSRLPGGRHAREAPAARTRADPERREVPPRSSGPPDSHRHLLAQSRHRHAPRRRRQHPGAAGDDPRVEPSRAGQLARRRPGIRAVVGQRARRRHDRRPAPPGGDVPRRRASGSDGGGSGSHRRRRDEIVLWDQTRVWIYTQDRPFSGSRIYAPTRNPDYNDSNYRSTVSLPGWAAPR